MTIDVIDALEGLEKLRTDWLDLWQSCPRATPFQSPQWLLPWTRHLYGGGQICALAIRDNQQLIGFAPLFRWGIDRRIVSFLGAGISDYGDLLFAPGCEAQCVSALQLFLANEDDDWDVLDLQELRCGSALVEGWRTEACSVCPVLELSMFPGSMDHKHRTDVRRARNKLSKSPELRLVTANETTLPEYIEDFFRLHKARWGALSDSLLQFHQEVAENFLKTGHLRLSLLQIGDTSAAAIYAFTCGNTLYCYLSGFDPDMAKVSPGAVLLQWVIEQAVAEGIQEVDFLRKSEAYKYLWGARDRINYAVRHVREA